jgi:peroxiredoxin
MVSLNLILTLAIVRRINNLPQFAETVPLEKLEVGETAPDFVADTLDGGSVNLAHFAGQPLSLLFISPTCEPCRTQVSILTPLHSTLQKAGINIKLVSFADELSTTKFMQEFNTCIPTLIAPRETNHFGDDYKVFGTPWYYIINEHGKIEAGGPVDATWSQLLSKGTIQTATIKQ